MSCKQANLPGTGGGGGGLGGFEQAGKLPFDDCGVWAFTSLLNAATLWSWQAGLLSLPLKAVTRGCMHALEFVSSSMHSTGLSIMNAKNARCTILC